MNNKTMRIKHDLSFIRTGGIARRALGLTWLLFAGAAVAATPALLPGWQAQGALQPADQWLVAREAVTITAPLATNVTTRINLRLGELQRVATCVVEAQAGQSLELTLSASDDTMEEDVYPTGKETIPMPNSYVQLSLTVPGGEKLFSGRYYVRPHPYWYVGEDRKRAVANWQKFPSATARTLELRIETSGKHVGFWLDDRYVGGKELPGIARLRFQLSPGNAVAGMEILPPAPAQDRFVAIPTRGYRRSGTLKIAEMPLARGTVQVVNNVPFRVADDGDEINVGAARWLFETTGPIMPSSNDKDYCRSAFNSRPEDIILAVPTDDYDYAHLLCVVDPDTAKTPVITLRLTRFPAELGQDDIGHIGGLGRGGAIADSSMRLEQVGGKWPEGCKQVGSVKIKTEQGEKTLPLLYVTIPVNCGRIQDVLEENQDALEKRGLFIGRSTQSLDLELTRELHVIDTINYALHAVKPLGKPSGVHVYALTLERSPVKVRLRSEQVGQIFYESENPALSVELENRSDAVFKGKLAWQITDLDGDCRQGKQSIVVPVTAPGQPQRVRIDVCQPKLGWFGVRQPKYGWFGAELTLRDRNGRLIWKCPTSFAILPPDTRKAGRESPYGTWWFGGCHMGTRFFEEIGPLFQRAGLRHVCPGGNIQSQAKYGVSWSMHNNRIRLGDQGTPGLNVQPGVEWALVFHESSFGAEIVYPPEFIGKQPKQLNAGQEKKFKELWDKAIAYSKYCREKHPGLKLILGNSTTPFIAEFLRRGYPREYVDAIGNEDGGSCSMPEAPPRGMQSLFWEKEYAKLYKYNVPMTSCYEWRGRSSNDGTSELEQAQLYTRDLLQGLAFRMPSINIGLIYDTANAYYYTGYGSGGICHRNPLFNPKPSYMALATATRQLDGAVFQRNLNTGSPSLLAMQFAKDGRWVYALWLPRGQRDVTLTFAKDTTFELTDMNGNGRKIETRSSSAEISVSASPSYLETNVEIKDLSGGPTMCEPPPGKQTIIDTLTDLSRWTIAKEPDKQLETIQFDFPRCLGKIGVEVTADDQRKRAMQLTLQPQPEVPWPIARYVILKATNGIPVPGVPTSLGVWVRGNSGWGRVFWEFQDARGETYLSLAAFKSGYSSGAVMSKQTFINFDGWNYLSVELPFRYASGFYGPAYCNWTRTGGNGDWPNIGPDVAYPIRITRLIVELRDKVVCLADPIEVPNKSVRLRDLSATYAERQRQ